MRLRARAPSRRLASPVLETATRGSSRREIAQLFGPVTRRGSGCLGLLRRLDLSALVVAAGRARPVRRHGLAAVGAGDELDGRNLVVVGAPDVALRSAGAS